MGGRNRRGLHKRLSLTLQAVLLVGMGLSLYQGAWLNAFLVACILVLTLLPLVAGRRFHVFVPPELELLAIAFIFATLFLGDFHGYYLRYAWWDKVLHAGSAALLGIVGFLLVHVLNEHEGVDVQMRPRFVALFAFAFAVMIGAVWEIFEFGMDSLLGFNMQKSGLVDTMWDLIVDTVGGAFIAVLGYFYLIAGTDSFLERWIEAFEDRNPSLFRRDRPE